jgi:hypothetical protein
MRVFVIARLPVRDRDRGCSRPFTIFNSVVRRRARSRLGAVCAQAWAAAPLARFSRIAQDGQMGPASVTRSAIRIWPQREHSRLGLSKRL